MRQFKGARREYGHRKSRKKPTSSRLEKYPTVLRTKAAKEVNLNRQHYPLTDTIANGKTFETNSEHHSRARFLAESTAIRALANTVNNEFRIFAIDVRGGPEKKD